MKKKLKLKLLIIFGALAVVILIIVWAIMTSTNKLIFIKQPKTSIAPISTNNLEPLNNGVTPRDPNLSNEQNLIKDYIAAHLSELSPTKEVLGGKFYLTKITFINQQEANVNYEDGHIALEAKVSYNLDAQKLTIKGFEITKEN